MSLPITPFVSCLILIWFISALVFVLFLSQKHLMTLSVGLSHCSQSSLIDRLVVVDISPAQTSTFTDFRSYIQAMQEVKISSDIPRSTARRMAEDQLRSLVEVSAPRWTVAAFFYEIKPAMFKWRFAFWSSILSQFNLWSLFLVASPRIVQCVSSCSPTWWSRTATTLGGSIWRPSRLTLTTSWASPALTTPMRDPHYSWVVPVLITSGILLALLHWNYFISFM